MNYINQRLRPECKVATRSLEISLAVFVSDLALIDLLDDGA